MRKIAAFFADEYREAQAVLDCIDTSVLAGVNFHLDVAGYRRDTQETCEYAFREFCYGSPKAEKHLVIHDFAAPIDKGHVVPAVKYNYRSNLELELGQAGLGVVMLPSRFVDSHRFYDEIMEPLRRWDWNVVMLVMLPQDSKWDDISRTTYRLKDFSRLHYAFMPVPWKESHLARKEQRHQWGTLLTEFLRQTILRVGWGGNFYDDYADIAAFFDRIDFLYYGNVQSERCERYAALPEFTEGQKTFLGMKAWEFRQMINGKHAGFADA